MPTLSMRFAAMGANSGRRHWLIDQNAAWLLASFVLVSLFSFTMSATLHRQLTDTRQWVRDVSEIQSKIEAATTGIMLADSGVKGFALTGDEAQLRFYRDSEAEIWRDLTRLTEITKDHGQQVRLAEFARLVEKHLDGLAAVVAARDNEGLETARARIYAIDDHRLWTFSKDMKANAEQNLLEWVDREHRKSVLTLVAVGLSSLLALGLAGLVVVLLNRGLLMREKVLREKEGLLAQKDLLMREVDHRARNSLMLVHSFLTLRQRNAGSEVQGPLADAASRILTIARIHERLYMSGSLDRVDLAAYLKEICSDLASSLLPVEERSSLRFKATSSITIMPERAISLGLVMTELVTNAIKYGAPDPHKPIRVTMSTDHGHCKIVVADQGPGLPDDFAPNKKGGGLGMQIIQLLVRKLQGQFYVNRTEHGTRFTVIFPQQDAEEEEGEDMPIPNVTAFPKRQAA